MNADFSFARDLLRIEALASTLGAPTTPAIAERLGRYLELVVAWNRKLDLTAARGAASQVEVLLADAFVLSDAHIVPRGSRILDVGSGAGSPAVPLLLMRDDLAGLLVEPLRKRVAFLRTVLGTLALATRVSVLETKLDPVAPSLADAPFDVAMSRATFAPEIWAAAGVQLAARTLVLLATSDAPRLQSLAAPKLVHYRLPSNAAERTIAIYEHSPSAEDA